MFFIVRAASSVMFFPSPKEAAMAKLAASEAATAIAHQVTPSLDISAAQHAEREFVLLQNRCLGKVGWNLLD